MSATLWPKPIPIIGGTGEFASGKTLFGLSIDPGPRTLVYDFEKSTESYASIGFERIDVYEEMQKKFPRGYKPVDLFLWWRDHVKSIPAGKYTVIHADPLNDVDAGLTDWVFANPAHFGHTPGQYASMSGIAWGDVKAYYKTLLGDIAARCQTFYFTAHLGTKFDGKVATKERKIKGKETLQELASLFLWFDRTPNAQGVKPERPSARVLKSRLVHTAISGDEITHQSILPARIPVATPTAIRSYFLTPAGSRAPLETELVPEEKLSDDEKLLIRQQIAEAERDAALAKANGTTAAATSPAPATPTPTRISEQEFLARLAIKGRDWGKFKVWYLAKWPYGNENITYELLPLNIINTYLDGISRLPDVQS